ncbi:hypothetical protein SEA_MOLLYMUR_39 [Gordonia phage Mollymur]|uniref:Uncharacterized protein n=1 Tax=Gordonia phage Mollymur TaxID=2590895 RepID=A0A4Y6EBQ1_9CAUD|nr:hypothetical protein PQB84_gp086 [Gordonia phage Mollymur]QDF15400.1 hypothetical protein SEA_MOLLYMUR_39 [Gordonia phage Mollymur]
MSNELDTIWKLPETPGVTYTSSYGSGGQSGLPSNWIRIIGTRPGVPTEDNPDPDPIVVLDVGFAGP